MEYICQSNSVDIGISQVQQDDQSSSSSISTLLKSGNDTDLGRQKTFLIYIKDDSRKCFSSFNFSEFPPPLLSSCKNSIFSPVIRNNDPQYDNSNRKVTPLTEEQEGIERFNENLENDTKSPKNRPENVILSSERSTILRRDENTVWEVDLQALTIQASLNLVSPRSVNFRPNFSIVNALEPAVQPDPLLMWSAASSQKMFSFLSISKKTKYSRHLLRSRMTIKYVQFSLLIQFILIISVIGIEILLDQTVLQFKDHHLLLFPIPILGLMLIIILFSFIFLFIIGRYLRRLNKKEKAFDEIVTQGESNRNTESKYGSRGKLEHHLSKRIDHVMSSVEFRGTSELGYSPLCDRRNSLPFERVPHKKSENNYGSSGEHPTELSNNIWMPPRKKSIEGKQKRAKLGIENDNDTEENDQNIHESFRYVRTQWLVSSKQGKN